MWSTSHLLLLLQVKDNGIVLFCYPKANTAGCTTQAVGLSEKSDELAEAGFKVYGISADKPKSQSNWKTKANITCTLLCDPAKEVSESVPPLRHFGLCVSAVTLMSAFSFAKSSDRLCIADGRCTAAGLSCHYRLVA